MHFLCGISQYKDLGLLVLRLGIGASMMVHGWPKIIGGPSTWAWYGSQMSLLGITFAPVFWGLCAALAEFVGGACLASGLLMRVVPLILVLNMIVALVYHFNKGDGFLQYSQALELLVVFFSLWISGPGKYSLDAWLCK